ncbi:Spore germination protein [Thermaerobacter marianensis DSM 12885]|uniref:Spore germination protein n=1 Tax=Thermaerobacter marianensis (strain ATCC 700841 / DSM 12885 / JCM 10246 / 7p75a) TaxID=644966 RepID=E6SLW0_THEM7|nr:Spore germination protein [Thermaerobacter marianensis DSM 12885]
MTRRGEAGPGAGPRGPVPSWEGSLTERTGTGGTRAAPPGRHGPGDGAPARRAAPPRRTPERPVATAPGAGGTRAGVWVSGRGLAALFFFTLYQFGLLDGPMWLARAAGRFGWLVEAMGALMGVPLVLIMLDLAARFPGQTVYQYARTVLGRPVAFVANGLVLVYGLLFLGYFLRQFVDVVQTYLLPRTPLWAITGLVTLGIVLVVSLGPLALNRLAQMLLIPVVLASVVMLLIALRNVDVIMLLPLWPVPAAALAAVPTVGFFPFVPIKHLVVQLAVVRKPRDHVRSVLGTYAAVALFKVTATAATLAIFGDRAVALMAWPALEALRVVQVPLALLEELGLPGLVVYQVVLFVSSAVYFVSDYIGLPVWLGLGPRAMPWLLPLLAAAAAGVCLWPQDQVQMDVLRRLVMYGGLYAAVAYPVILWLGARWRRLGVPAAS